MRVSAFEGWDAVPAPVLQAAGYPNVANFFLSLDWFRVLYDHSIGKHEIPRIYVVSRDDGTLLSALFCLAERGSRRLRSMTNFYSVRYDVTPLGDHEAASDVGSAIGKYIAAERPRWTSVDLRCWRADSIALQALRNTLDESGFRTSTFFQFGNWTLDTGGQDFNAYYAKRPSQLRNTVRRREKKAREQYRVEYRCAASVEPGLETAIADFVKIYNASWKQPEPFPDFVPGLIRRTAELGLLRLGQLSFDGSPAAAQLWITDRSHAMIYKLAYDERFKETSAGSILSKALFEQAIDRDHAHLIDYGVGDDAYKRDWVETRGEIVGILAHNTRTLVGAAASTLEGLKARFKSSRERLRRVDRNETSQTAAPSKGAIE